MRALRFMLCSLFFASAALAQEPIPHAASKPNLTILMDQDLILPTAALARSYAKVSHTPLTTVVRTADTEEAIGQGLEAHVVISADEGFIERLAAQGMTDVSTIHDIAQAPLALITTTSGAARELFTKHISFAAMIYATPKLPVYISAPNAPAGSRSAALLKGYEFSETLASRAEVKDSRDDIMKALREKDGLALMLASDVTAEPDMVILNVLPGTLSKPVRYQVAVLASESMESARNFVNYLNSKEARDLLATGGFEPPGKAQ